MTRLKWTGPGEFTDHSEGVIVRQPQVVDLDPALAEKYLSLAAPGWERPDDEDGEDEDEGADTEPDGAGSEADSGFDAEAFVDGDWRAVVAAVEDGEADGHLDTVRAAEQARENGARSSVITALAERDGDENGEG